MFKNSYIIFILQCWLALNAYGSETTILELPSRTILSVHDHFTSDVTGKFFIVIAVNETLFLPFIQVMVIHKYNEPFVSNLQRENPVKILVSTEYKREMRPPFASIIVIASPSKVDAVAEREGNIKDLATATIRPSKFSGVVLWSQPFNKWTESDFSTWLDQELWVARISPSNGERIKIFFIRSMQEEGVFSTDKMQAFFGDSCWQSLEEQSAALDVMDKNYFSIVKKIVTTKVRPVARPTQWLPPESSTVQTIEDRLLLTIQEMKKNQPIKLTIDSFLALLELISVTKDENKINRIELKEVITFEALAVANLGFLYMNNGFPKEAVEAYKKNLQLVDQLEQEFGIFDKMAKGQAYANLGIIYQKQGDLSKAIEYNKKHLAIAKEEEDLAAEGRAYCNLAIIYNQRGESKKAIDFHMQHLAICEKTNDLDGQGRAYVNLGNIYHACGKYLDAIEFYGKHYRIAMQTKNPADLALGHLNIGKATTNIGEFFEKNGNQEQAISFYSEARVSFQKELDIVRRTNTIPRDSLVRSLKNMGQNYLKLNQYQLALDAFLEIEKISTPDVEQLVGSAFAYCGMSNYKEAITRFEQAHEKAKSFSSKDKDKSLIKSYQRLAALYAKSRNFEKGLELMEEFFHGSIQILPKKFQTDLIKSPDIQESLYEASAGHMRKVKGEKQFESFYPRHHILYISHVYLNHATHNEMCDIWFKSSDEKIIFHSVNLTTLIDQKGITYEQFLDEYKEKLEGVTKVTLRPSNSLKADSQRLYQAFMVKSGIESELQKKSVKPLVIIQAQKFFVPFSTLCDAENSYLAEKLPLVYAKSQQHYKNMEIVKQLRVAPIEKEEKRVKFRRLGAHDPKQYVFVADVTASAYMSVFLPEWDTEFVQSEVDLLSAKTPKELILLRGLDATENGLVGAITAPNSECFIHWKELQNKELDGQPVNVFLAAEHSSHDGSYTKTQLFSKFPESLSSFVFFSSQSFLAEAFHVEKVIPTVIFPSWEVEESARLEFIRLFYRSKLLDSFQTNAEHLKRAITGMIHHENDEYQSPTVWGAFVQFGAL